MSVTKIKHINNIIAKLGKDKKIFFNDLISKAQVKQDELKSFISRGYIKGLDKIDFGDREDFVELVASVVLRDAIVTSEPVPSSPKKSDNTAQSDDPLSYLNPDVKVKVINQSTKLVKQLKVLTLDGVLAILKYNDMEVINCLNDNLKAEVLEYIELITTIRKCIKPKIADRMLTELIVEEYKEALR